MTTTPRLGATEWAASQATPNLTVNEAIRKVEQGASAFIAKDKDANTPPGSPVNGDCYIVAATATGAWAGKEKNLAIYNAGWSFVAPIEGTQAYLQDENALYRYDGSAWVVPSTSAAVEVQDEGVVEEAAATSLNFTGAGVTVTGDGVGGATIDIPGGGGGGGGGLNYPTLVVPALAGFSWVNQGTASAATDTEALVMTVPEVGTTNQRLLVKTAPATPYTITALLRGCMRPRQYLGFGLVFRNSGSGLLQTFGTEAESIASTPQVPVKVTKWNSPTTYNSDYRIIPYNELGLYWLRISDNGTDRKCSVSANGKDFIEIHSIGRTDFLTADQVGWCASANNNGASPSFSLVVELLSWVET